MEKLGIKPNDVDYADLYYLFVDIRRNVGEPVARLEPLGWTCIGPPDDRAEAGTRTHSIQTLLIKEHKKKVCNVKRGSFASLHACRVAQFIWK